ncbi:MAG: O-antigen ligase family protein [Bacteroidia bacterium]|nr:O-antigen ligase family protein [Bacteroidia bacterium]
MIFLALIQARGAILSIAVLTIAISGYLILFKKNYILGVWKLLILISLFGCYYLFSPNAKSNIQSIPNDIQSYLSNDKFTYSSTAMRLILWEASLEVFKKNQYLGVGTGDVFTELKKEYLNRNPDLIRNSRVKGKPMNCHNQAIQSAVGLGVIGIIVFLSMLIIPGIKAYQTNNYLFLMTILILFISMLTESILERQIGITTFSFFCSLFYSHQKL